MCSKEFHLVCTFAEMLIVLIGASEPLDPDQKVTTFLEIVLVRWKQYLIVTRQ
jgi:hypothetical protein